MNILFTAVEYGTITEVGKMAKDIENIVINLEKFSEHKISVCLPFYRNIFLSNYQIQPFTDQIIYISGLAVSFWRTEINNITFYFIKNDEYFSFRENIYGYSDDSYRFTLFSMSVIELIKNMEIKPDIIHVNDWHTSFIPLFIELNNLDIKTVLTIHNVRYQGISDIKLLYFANISYQYFSTGIVEFYNNVNILKAGLFFSNQVTTLSKFYLKQIQDDYDTSFGLEGVLKLIESKSTGISNGIDDSYNPETDITIKSNYSINDLSGKDECKLALQKELDLPIHSEVPLVVIPSSYVSESEIWLLNSIIPYLIRMEIQIVILGNKLADFEKNIRGVSFRLNCTVTSMEENEENIRKVFSGADIFLDISLEALNDHMIKTALKYGVIPIVFKESPDLDIDGNSFRIFNFTTEDLINTIKYTVNRYYYLEKWNERVSKVMAFDFSWKKTIEEYDLMYKQVLEKNI